MVIRASDQMTITDITDSYSVVLSSEAFTIQGNKDGKPLTQTELVTDIYAYNGTESVDKSRITINAEDCQSISGASIETNKNQDNVQIKITVGTTCLGGEIVIPITIDDSVTFEKRISVAIAKTGMDGISGEPATYITITSSHGTIFREKPFDEQVVLTARVFEGGIEKTDAATGASICWYQDNEYKISGYTYTINWGDVEDNISVFRAEIEDKSTSEITIKIVKEPNGSFRYYQLISSDSLIPEKPTTFEPSDEWTDTEPGYNVVTDGDKTLYFVDCETYSDGSFIYSEVSVSGSFEAIKATQREAENKIGALGLLLNHSDIENPEDGSLYLCKRDPNTLVLVETDGWVYSKEFATNNVSGRVTIPRTYINMVGLARLKENIVSENAKNLILGNDVFILYGKPKENSASNSLFLAFYNSNPNAWRYITANKLSGSSIDLAADTGSMTISGNDANPLVLGRFVSPKTDDANAGSKSIEEAELYYPPKRWIEVYQSKSAYSRLSDWCVENDQSVFDGSYIATGTVEASKLNVTQLSAITGDVGTLTTGVIKSSDYSDSGNTITGFKIDLTNKEVKSQNLTINENGSIISKRPRMQTSDYLYNETFGSSAGGLLDLTKDSSEGCLIDTKNFRITNEGDVYVNGSISVTGNGGSSTDVQSVIDELNSLTTTENNATVINGGKIKTGSITALGSVTTGALQSVNYEESLGKATQGFKIDLNNHVIKSPNFNVDASGNTTANNMALTNGIIQKEGYEKGDDGVGMVIDMNPEDSQNDYYVYTPNFKIDGTGDVFVNGSITVSGGKNNNRTLEDILSQSNFYGVCSTSPFVAEKVVECAGFTNESLVDGTVVTVLFKHENTSTGQTNLNVAGTGNFPIASVSQTGNITWSNYDVVPFEYKNRKWYMGGSDSCSVVQGMLNKNVNNRNFILGSADDIQLSIGYKEVIAFDSFNDFPNGDVSMTADTSDTSQVRKIFDGKNISDIVYTYGSSKGKDEEAFFEETYGLYPSFNQEYHCLWKKESVVYTTSRETNVIAICEYNGAGLSGISHTYAVTDSDNQPLETDITLTESNALSVLNDTNKYLWQKETVTFLDGSSMVTVSLLAVYNQKLSGANSDLIYIAQDTGKRYYWDTESGYKELTEEQVSKSYKPISSDDVYERIVDISPNINEQNDDEWIFSCSVSDSDTNSSLFKIELYESAIDEDIAPVRVAYTDWKTTSSSTKASLKLTFENGKSISDVATCKILYKNESGTRDRFTLSKLKLETGASASEWEIAPEDIDSNITIIKRNITNHSNAISSIQDETDELKNETNKLNDNVSGLITEVDKTSTILSEWTYDTTEHGYAEQLKSATDISDINELVNQLKSRGITIEYNASTNMFIGSSEGNSITFGQDYVVDYVDSVVKERVRQSALSGKTKINGGLIESKTIDAEHIYTKELSAINSNLGTITTGLIQSEDESFVMDFREASDKGITVRSKVKDTEMRIDADGTRVYSLKDTTKPVAQFISTGMDAEKIICREAEIAGLRIAMKGEQVWITII